MKHLVECHQCFVLKIFFPLACLMPLNKTIPLHTFNLSPPKSTYGVAVHSSFDLVHCVLLCIHFQFFQCNGQASSNPFLYASSQSVSSFLNIVGKQNPSSKASRHCLVFHSSDHSLHQDTMPHTLLCGFSPRQHCTPYMAMLHSSNKST